MASRRQSSDAPVKAAIYARVSSDDGRQSTVNQLQQLRELASIRQFEVVREYLDEETGASASRPAFLPLLRDARLRRFRVLLIADLDRLTREGAAAGFGYLAELDRFAVRVISLGQSWLDYDPVVDDDPELREMRSIQTAVALTWASLERQKLSRRTKAGTHGE
jgi:DNA invertase Pin-like site-specific DNA recombinase